jgi:hypothetical protein
MTMSNGGTAQRPRDKSAPFSKVFKDELEDLKKRRLVVNWDNTWKLPVVNAQTVQATDQPGPAMADRLKEIEAVRKLRSEALDNHLVGLALSGGGIRSATFCLGVLQGLAQLRLLKRFDYLSTVSGGGYIGAWLAAWLKREGNLENVETQLRPNHIDQAKAERQGVPKNTVEGGQQGTVFDDEPEPIRHLRAYSNYLAPRPGLFSADGWVLIALYLRNLLLNQLVLLLAVLALLFAMAGVIQSFSLAAYLEDIPRWKQQANVEAAIAGCPVLSANGLAGPFILAKEQDTLDNPGKESFLLSNSESFWAHRNPVICGFLALLAFSLLVVACINIYRSIPPDLRPGEEAPVDQTPPGKMIRRLHKWILMPLLASAIIASLLSMYTLGPLEVEFQYWLGLCFTVGFAALHFGFTLPVFLARKTGDLRWLFSGLVAGGCGGLLLYWLLVGLHSATDPYYFYVPAIVTLSPPLLLGVFVLTGFVHVGILGRLIGEAQREWWSSLGGWILMYGAAWLALFGAAIFGSWLVLPSEPGQWTQLRPITVALTWGVSMVGGLLAAHSAQTGSGRPGPSWTNRLTDLLVKAAPAVFLVGIFVLVAVLATVLERWSLGERPLLPTQQQFLSQLNSALGPHFAEHLPSWACPGDPLQWDCWIILFFLFGVAVLFYFLALLLGRFVDINVFSLQGLYANRLIRCYLGASRPKINDGERSPAVPSNSKGPPRRPNAITGFDPLDDFHLRELRIGRPSSGAGCNLGQVYWGPLLIINTSLNLVRGEELAWQERKAEAFALTASHCGSRTTGYRPTEGYAAGDPQKEKETDGLRLGIAVGISGAAVSPNMGYYSSTSVTALLTLFNARLGAWLGNPLNDHSWWHPGPKSGLFYLLREMFGRTDARSKYVYLSDGGHFENLGVYELIRRRCRYIVLCDGGADPNFTLENFGNLIRKVRIDFGVRIDIDLSPLRPESPERRIKSHVAVGKIRYGDVDPGIESADDDDPYFNAKRNEGLLVYIKPGLTGDESSDLENYVAEHPDFPHQSTLNQFFTESQFESYRALGYHSVTSVFLDLPCDLVEKGPSEQLFTELYMRWFPPPPNFTPSYLESNREYIGVAEALQKAQELRHLAAEIYPNTPDSKELLLRDTSKPRSAEIRSAERFMVARMLTVMENTWFGLHLNRFKKHPLNRGWMAAYHHWLASATVQANWEVMKTEFSQEFQGFVDVELKKLRGGGQPS